MPNFGHVIQGLRSLRFSRGSKSPSPGIGTIDHCAPHTPEPIAVLSLIPANLARSFKGLPQEMVDEILKYLEDDSQTIRACSLTCEALFCSSRPILHRRLCVVGLEGYGPLGALGVGNPVRFPTLSMAIECGLTHYTRELTMDPGIELGLTDLQPFLPQLQTFSRLTSLTLRHFEPSFFLPTFDKHLGHLAHQIQSFQFVYPSGYLEGLLHFISRFPNLDNLGFCSLPQWDPFPSEEYDLSVIECSPTLRGTLQLVDVPSRGSDFLECLTRLPSGLRFRSLEFNRCVGVDLSAIIQGCSSTVQHLTYVMCPGPTLPAFNLSTCSDLRVLEIHIGSTVVDHQRTVSCLTSTIHSITSPKFHGFILVIEDAKYSAEFEKRAQQNAMRNIDQTLSNLSRQTGMKMSVKCRNRGAGPYVVMKEVFPLMVSAGAFECQN